MSIWELFSTGDAVQGRSPAKDVVLAQDDQASKVFSVGDVDQRQQESQRKPERAADRFVGCRGPAWRK